MDDVTKQGLLLNIDAIKAEKTLHAGTYDPADPPQVYRLYKLAHGDEELARKAALEAARIFNDAKSKSQES